MKLDEVHIELVGRCNATCSHCTWQAKTTDANAIMPLALATRLIDEAADLGVRTMNFNGIGEPTLHPDLLRVLAHAENRLPDYVLSTNCHDLPHVADTLRTFRKLTLILAVPWITPAAFRRRCADNAAEYLAASPLNRRVLVQMVCVEDVRPNVPDMLAFLPHTERENVFLYFKQPTTWPGMKPQQGFVPDVPEHPKIIRETNPTPRSIGASCDTPDRFLMVSSDGSLSPCCVTITDWGIGNVRFTTLAEVWASRRMEIVREQWRAGSKSVPCGECKL